MRKLTREPLVHFALASIAIFAVHFLWTAERDNAANTITITQTDVERLVALYTSEAGTVPTAQDLEAMIADQVRDEALAREARRLGLHIGDTVVDRRLAQKMTFLVSDLTEMEPPTEEDLQNWYTEHAQKFETPARATFDHVFFSSDRHGDRTDEMAKEQLTSLNGQSPNWQQAGDPFMLSRSYGDLPLREVARLFGQEFAQSLSSLDAGTAWQGPVKSAFGFHLVRVRKMDASNLPPLEQVRRAVEADWLDTKRREQNADAIAEIVNRYNVVVEDQSGN